jgi:hypothetical protein
MHTLPFILRIVALVFFGLAGLGVPTHPRVQFIGWGLFCTLLSYMLPL